MRKILPAVLACMFVFATTADAQTAKRTHKKHHKRAKPTYYYNSDGTLSTTRPTGTSLSDAKRPSAYKGDRVPENDGPKKNEQRNINNNSGQPLPSNSGK